MSEVWYRYSEHVVVPWDADRDSGGIPYVESLICDEFPVLRHTPKGVWLDQAQGYCAEPDKRFVLNASMRRWACATKEEALLSFKARKLAQIRILKTKIRLAHQSLLLVYHPRKHILEVEYAGLYRSLDD